MKRLLWHWIISSAALILSVLALPGVAFMGNGNVAQIIINAIWIAPLFGLVNGIVSAIAGAINFVAMPVNMLTLGCFGFVLSTILYTAFLFGLCRPGGPLSFALQVDTFGWALALALMMGLFSTVLNIMLPGKNARRR